MAVSKSKGSANDHCHHRQGHTRHYQPHQKRTTIGRVLRDVLVGGGVHVLIWVFGLWASDLKSQISNLKSQISDLRSQISDPSDLKPNNRIRSTFDVHRIDKPDVSRLGGHNQGVCSFACTKEPD